MFGLGQQRQNKHSRLLFFFLNPTPVESEAANRAAGFFCAVSVINEWRTFQGIVHGCWVEEKK
jgi:inosine/xanthosine triphosphate pyrophosphatase family protein